MRILAVALLVIAVAAAAFIVPRTEGSPRKGRAYYVSPAGDDRWAGTRLRPWRTVARVNRAALRSGDTVSFAGGASFAGELDPAQSGLTYSSYGRGRATLTGGIWFAGLRDLTFRNLAVDGSSSGGHLSAVTSSAHGGGSSHVTIAGCVFTHVRVGINSANAGDASWTISNTLVRYTGDSGVIVVGHDMTFANDAILDTGLDRSITYPKHGVYAKGRSLTFTHDTVRRFSADGISLRYRDATVDDSTISDGPIGIAWFQEDASAGTTTITHNTITHTTESGIYVSPSDAAGDTRESFVITGNTVIPSRGNATDLNPTSGQLKLASNHFQGAVLTP